MKIQWKFLASFLIATVATNAQAHGIWFAQRSGEMALIYGEGAHDDATVKRLSKFKGIAAYDAAGNAVATQLITTDHLLLVDMQAKPAVLTGVMDNGYFTHTADGKSVPKPKSEVPDAGKSGRYFKYGVRLLGDLKAPLAALPGQVLQILPLSAALPKHDGETMKLRVLFNGKPVAGAKVVTDFVNDPDDKPLLTKKDGTVTVKVRNHGLNVIFASLEVPAPAGEDADIVQHATTLSFALEDDHH